MPLMYQNRKGGLGLYGEKGEWRESFHAKFTPESKIWQIWQMHSICQIFDGIALKKLEMGRINVAALVHEDGVEQFDGEP